MSTKLEESASKRAVLIRIFNKNLDRTENQFRAVFWNQLIKIVRLKKYWLMKLFIILLKNNNMSKVIKFTRTVA